MSSDSWAGALVYKIFRAIVLSKCDNLGSILWDGDSGDALVDMGWAADAGILCRGNSLSSSSYWVSLRAFACSYGSSERLSSRVHWKSFGEWYLMALDGADERRVLGAG